MKTRASFSKLISSFTLLSLLLCAIITATLLAACGDSATTSPPASTTTVAAVNTLPQPTATPIPLPNKILIGDENNPWGEIVRYDASTAGKLEQINLSDENRAKLATIFSYAPALALSTAISAKAANSFTLKLKPDVAEAFQNGSLSFMKSNSFDGTVRSVLIDDKGVIKSQASLQKVGTILQAGAVVFTVLAVATSQYFLVDINKQLETLTTGINDIKKFLDAQLLGQIKGNLAYIKDVSQELNQQKLTPEKTDDFRKQLESIERDSQGHINALKQLMDNADKSFKEFKLDKAFVVLQDSDKIKQLQGYLDDHKQQADNYLLALSVRGLASQVASALPENRSTALKRLTDTRTSLKEWLDTQNTFYKVVEDRIPEMDGFLADNKKQDGFKKQATDGKKEASDKFTKLDTLFSNTIDKIKSQSTNQSVVIVVELDENGKVVKASKVVQ